jgi:thiaminase/transcriptional activator TenA
MSYGSTFALWRSAAGPHWPAFTGHKFVKGLGGGTLPQVSFLHYLVQDYVFLIHFSRAWALAVTKSETLEEMRHCASTVNTLINDEIALHIKICANFGISEEVLFTAQERPENLAYTRYVLDAGHSGDLLDLLATLAPCVMGYGEIGADLGQTATSDVYRSWVSTYAGNEYQQVCVDVGILIDNAISRRLGYDPEESPRWKVLCNRFETATRLEISFWDMGLSP